MRPLERAEVCHNSCPDIAFLTHDTIAAAVESLLNVPTSIFKTVPQSLPFQANPRLALQRDDDERFPIHWAVSYNHMPVVELLVSSKDFDPDVQVSLSLCQAVTAAVIAYMHGRMLQAGHH